MHRKTAMILLLLLLGLLFAMGTLRLTTLDLNVTLNLPIFVHAIAIPESPGTRPAPTTEVTEPLSPGTEAAGSAAGNGNSASSRGGTTDPGISTKTWVALDTARISPDGPSVFAGRAAPFAYVTVLEGTTPVATAQAGADGDWALVTEHKFTSPDPKYSLSASDKPPASSSPQPLDSPIPPAAKTESTTSPSVRLLKEFENAVGVAREQAAHNDTAEKNDGGHLAALPDSTISRPNARSPAQALPDHGPYKIPVPMTFVYNEAALTAEGRRVSELLAEYLSLKHYSAVTLSGHADERGSPDYNMELSKQRLDTILRLLRDEGYKGKVELLPKGASEPFTGVDRSRYAREQLMQLDRRVELREVQ